MPQNIDSSSNPCSGCGACAVICPQKAIALKIDNEGFFTAVIDHEKCIECGKCVTVCLKFGTGKDISKLEDGTLYAAKSKSSDTVKTCSSGGIAYELSLYAIARNITVVGVIYNYEKGIAETVIAETVEEVEKFKGSKYLQSYTVDAFSYLVEKATKDKKKRFLVFGTPCQIFGLSKTLENLKIREQFILVDLFCHGVPSYLVWNSYLEGAKKKLGGSDIKQVDFRDKSVGWHNFVLTVKTEEKELKQASDSNSFYNAFFDNILLSKACFECEVRRKVSGADIRLGDFWGKRYQNTEEGISAVLLLTDKGVGFFEPVKDIEILEKADYNECVSKQSVKKYSGLALREDAFSKLIKTSDVKKTMRSYRKKFPYKKRAKLVAKNVVAFMPGSLRALVRRVYKNSV